MSDKNLHEKSTKDLLGVDPFADQQELTDGTNQYQQHQDRLQPDSYIGENETAYNVFNFFKQLFPFISAATLGGLALYISVDFTKMMAGEFALMDWLLALITIVGSALLIISNEIIKNSKLRKAFKNVATKKKVKSGTIIMGAITCILSIIGSSAGLYMITYQLTDKTGKLEKGANAAIASARAGWGQDSLRIVQNYSELIEQKKEARNAFQAGKFRTKRNSLSNEVIGLTETMEAKLEAARTNKEVGISGINGQFMYDASTSQGKADYRGWIAVVVIVVLEIFNIICHRYTWMFSAKAALEGLKLKVIDPKESLSRFEEVRKRVNSSHAAGATQLDTLIQLLALQAGAAPSPAPTASTGGLGGLTREQKEAEIARLSGSSPTLAGDEEEIIEPEKPKRGKMGFERARSIEVETIDLPGQENFIQVDGQEVFTGGKLPEELPVKIPIFPRKNGKKTKNFSSVNQPGNRRKIDQGKYNQFISMAKLVLLDKKKYNVSEIHRRLGGPKAVNRKTLDNYLKIARENKDLQ